MDDFEKDNPFKLDKIHVQVYVNLKWTSKA